MTNWAQMYRECNADAIAVVESLTPEQLEARMPATPDWSLHQLAAHLAGEASDAVTGRMDGAPAPEWTARHVAEREGRTAEERWLPLYEASDRGGWVTCRSTRRRTSS